MCLTIVFDGDWIAEKSKNGERVIRYLEKWLKPFDYCKLKKSTVKSLVLEIDAAARPRFVKELEAILKKQFGAKNPERLINYSDYSTQAQTRHRDMPAEESNETAKNNAEIATPKRGKIAQDKSAAEPPPDIDKVLADLLTRVPLCHNRELATYFRETAEVVPMLQRMDALESFWRVYPLVSIDMGYGLTDFLHELAELYQALGLIRTIDEKSVREITVTCDSKARFEYEIWENILNIAKDMHRLNAKSGCVRPILCLKVGAWQDRLMSAEIKQYLRQINAVADNFTLVFSVPFVDARAFNSTIEALGDIFDVKPLIVPPVQTDHLVEYARKELARRSFELDDNAVTVLEQWILNEKRDDSFFGYKTMDKLVNKMIYEKALRNCRNGKVNHTIAGADIVEYEKTVDPEGDPEEELKNMVGLAEVKRKISEIIYQIKVQSRLSKKGKRVKRPAIHMLFSGNPGTGKTTVARIVARMLKREGVLRKGHLLEVRGRDLCGEYIGQTAPKTSAICRDAYGSVLFIDEAYSLFRGDGNDRDYGREALDTLIAEMENHRDDMCVILAGYTDDMETMLQGNEGLRSRIPYSVNFPDYTREELVKIFFSMVKGNFDYEKPLEKAVAEFFNQISDEKLKEKGFSNARFVRNLYERTWSKAAYRSRLGDGDEEIKLQVSDLTGATEDREFKQLMEKSTRCKIGFNA